MNGHGDAREAPRSQQNLKLDGMNEGMRVLSYLISGVLFYGFLGWLGDHFLGSSFLLPIGIVAGAALGCYMIIRRFGRVEDSPAATGGPVAAESLGNAEEGSR
jgi:F0F1-type ATP synthase assembly protein I